MGFFHHKDHQEELQNAFSRTSTVLQQAATADDQNKALPHGVGCLWAPSLACFTTDTWFTARMEGRQDQKDDSDQPGHPSRASDHKQATQVRALHEHVPGSTC